MTVNELNNKTCAYRDCENFSSVRMEFPMGFSALFCSECAAALQKQEIASRITRNKDMDKDIKKRIDGTSTPASIASRPNKKMFNHG